MLGDGATGGGATYGAERWDRASQAVPALVLSLIGLLCCGLPAVVGAVLAQRDLRAIDAGRTDPSKRSTAQIALGTGLVGIVLWVMAIVGYGLLLASVFERS